MSLSNLSLQWRSPSCVLYFVGFVLATALLATSSAVNTTESSGNRYEVFNSQTDIETFRQTYNLTRVAAKPTNAALHTGWPETLVSILVCVYIQRVVKWYNDGMALGEYEVSLISFLISVVQVIAWIISFGLLEHNKDTAGWANVTGWVSTLVVASLDGPGPVLYPLAAFQWAASFALIIQRWRGEIGTVAYSITDTYGCTPYGPDIAYLEAGARARAFRIIQTVGFAWMTSLILSLWRINIRSGLQFKGEIFAALEAFLGPVMIYEIVIARLGTPVVISGNCMLVELDPKLGFLNTELAAYWKAIVELTGL